MHPNLKLQGILVLFGMALLPFTLSYAQNHSPIDTDATAETKMLFKNLEKLSEDHTLFGHHNATEAKGRNTLNYLYIFNIFKTLIPGNNG